MQNLALFPKSVLKIFFFMDYTRIFQFNEQNLQWFIVGFVGSVFSQYMIKPSEFFIVI